MTIPDLRSQLAAAQRWACDLTADLGADQLDRPTPCAEFDVRALLEHLFGCGIRTHRYATDRAVGDAPATVPLSSDDPAAVAAGLRRLCERGEAAWAEWSAEDLGAQTVTGPFGTVPAGASVGIMASEFLVHAWDLAVATDQPSEADPAVAATLLRVMQQALPGEGQRADVPFADPVPPAEGAGPTERLANWTGHARV